MTLMLNTHTIKLNNVLLQTVAAVKFVDINSLTSNLYIEGNFRHNFLIHPWWWSLHNTGQINT